MNDIKVAQSIDTNGRKRFRGNGPLSTGKYDSKLDDLSHGNFDPHEELALLRGELPKSASGSA
jgi:hypothetical protein